MPVITRSKRADYDGTSATRVPQIADSKAAADIAGAAIPLKLTPTGWVPAKAGDPVTGWSSREALTTEPVTAFGAGMRFHYASGLTKGQPLYLTANPGELSTDVNGPAVAIAVSSTDIVAWSGCWIDGEA